MRTSYFIVVIAVLLYGGRCERRSIRQTHDLLNDFVNKDCGHAIGNKYESSKIDVANIRFILKTLNDYSNQVEDTFFKNAEKLWRNDKYKKGNPLVIFISGYTTNLRKDRSPSHDALGNAYARFRPEINFVTIDTDEYLDHKSIHYFLSALNTVQIAEHLAEELKYFIQDHPEMVDNIHLIGHSLGAQICGNIGRELKKANISLPRITGLDPAGPCFYEDGLLKGLSTGDAKLVDIIHSNPGTFGQEGRVGDIDFYPNGSKDKQLARGCKRLFGTDVIYRASQCSHGRAWKYYAESVLPGNEHNFLPTNCTLDGKTINCDADNYPMGFAVNSTYPKGIYILETNEKCPYGKNITTTKIKVCKIFEKESAVVRFFKNFVTSNIYGKTYAENPF